jgi:hypothetical protein
MLIFLFHQLLVHQGIVSWEAGVWCFAMQILYHRLLFDFPKINVTSPLFLSICGQLLNIAFLSFHANIEFKPCLSLPCHIRLFCADIRFFPQWAPLFMNFCGFSILLMAKHHTQLMKIASV